MSARAILVIIAVTMGLLAALPTVAQPADPPGEEPANRPAPERWFLRNHDANGDGKVERDEFRGSENEFDRRDANGDGVIDAADLAARRAGNGMAQATREERWQRALQAYDANGDGVLSAAEYPGPERTFNAIDRDGDGVVTSVEARQGARPTGAWRRPQTPADRWESLLERCDADGDGAITAEEWPGRADAFERLDADGSGTISRNELEQMRPEARREPAERANPALLLVRMMDENGDGRLSSNEWQKAFDTTDGNGDNVVSADELYERVRRILRPEQPPAPPEQ